MHAYVDRVCVLPLSGTPRPRVSLIKDSKG